MSNHQDMPALWEANRADYYLAKMRAAWRTYDDAVRGRMPSGEAYRAWREAVAKWNRFCAAETASIEAARRARAERR